MTNDSTNLVTSELREVSVIATVVAIVGGLLCLISTIMIVLQHYLPPKVPPPLPNVEYFILIVGTTVLCVGIYLLKYSRVGLRVEPRQLTITAFEISIPWSAIKDIDLVPSGPGRHDSPALAINLLPEHRQSIANTPLSNFQYAHEFDPQPDLFVTLGFWGFGREADTALDFVNELKKRVAEALGRTYDGPIIPLFDAELEPRDTSETGPDDRIYVHDLCGSCTLINGSSFHWIVNPLRYSSGESVCSGCGVATEMTLRWADTGETVSRFRSRMWRHTPLLIKLSQFVIIPSLAGFLSWCFLPRHPNVPVFESNMLSFILGLVLCNAVFAFSPISRLVPALARLNYHTYR